MNKILEMKFGSHLYGTDTPESDLDLKGVYIPTGREIVLHSYGRTISLHRAKEERERNTKDDVDVEIFSLDRYLSLLMEGQTVALDMLFAPEDFFLERNDPAGIFKTIFDNRQRLITRNIVAFVGHTRQQAAKYGIKGSRMDALKRTVAFLEPLPLYDRLNQHAEGIAALVAECADFITLEKTPLVEVLSLPASRHSDSMMDYLHVCGRKVPFNATVKLATVMGAAREHLGEKKSVAGCLRCEQGVVTMQRENLSKTAFACICPAGEFWKRDRMAAWNGQEFQTHNGVDLRVWMPGGYR